MIADRDQTDTSATELERTGCQLHRGDPIVECQQCIGTKGWLRPAKELFRQQKRELDALMLERAQRADVRGDR